MIIDIIDIIDFKHIFIYIYIHTHTHVFYIYIELHKIT